ncbi:MAG: helix-turn-helix transcriptional regulator [Eubacteriaceae bacterium]|nr:helix-turn-helix transcriptional regulator [Eubacteriaceae bacterium]
MEEKRSEFDPKISLAAARTNADMTQLQVSDIMHISKQTLINWELGRSRPKPADVDMLSKIYKWPKELFDVQIR